MSKVINLSKKKLNAIRSVLLCAVIAVMAIIFALSADTADESNNKSSPLSGSLLRAVLSVFDLSEEEMEEATHLCSYIVRKTAHFCEYALLGGLLFGLCTSFYLTRLKGIIISQIVGSLYAVSDEIHQYFVPGRSCQFSDMLLDSCGVFTGIMAILLILTIYIRIKSKKNQKILQKALDK